MVLRPEWTGFFPALPSPPRNAAHSHAKPQRDARRHTALPRLGVQSVSSSPPTPARTGLSSQRRSAALRDNGCASAFGCRGMLLPCRGLRTARGQGRGRLPAEGQRWVGREERPERVNVPSTAHAGSRRHRRGRTLHRVLRLSIAHSSSPCRAVPSSSGFQQYLSSVTAASPAADRQAHSQDRACLLFFFFSFCILTEKTLPINTEKHTHGFAMKKKKTPHIYLIKQQQKK